MGKWKFNFKGFTLGCWPGARVASLVGKKCAGTASLEWDAHAMRQAGCRCVPAQTTRAAGELGQGLNLPVALSLGPMRSQHATPTLPLQERVHAMQIMGELDFPAGAAAAAAAAPVPASDAGSTEAAAGRLGSGGAGRLGRQPSQSSGAEQKGSGSEEADLGEGGTVPGAGSGAGAGAAATVAAEGSLPEQAQGRRLRLSKAGAAFLLGPSPEQGDRRVGGRVGGWAGGHMRAPFNI